MKMEMEKSTDERQSVIGDAEDDDVDNSNKQIGTKEAEGGDRDDGWNKEEEGDGDGDEPSGLH